MRGKRLGIWTASLLGLSLLATVSRGEEAAFDWDLWRSIPVLEGGRVKPLDTHAWEFVTSAVGRGTFRPEAFHTLSAADVVSWPELAKMLSSAPQGTAAARIFSALSADLQSKLKSANLDVSKAQAELARDEPAIQKLLAEHALKEGDILPPDIVREEISQSDPEAKKLFDRAAENLKAVLAAGEVKAKLLRELNGLLEWKELYQDAAFKEVAIGDEAQKLAQKGAASLDTPELARLNRALLQSALAGAMTTFEPSGPANVEDRKYSSIELYVTWLMTWQGWDQVRNFQDFSSGRDDEAYWKFHKPDAWDETPLFDARYEAMGPRLLPDTASRVSPRSLAANDDFDQWVMAVRDRLRKAGENSMQEPSTVEKKAMEVLEAYLNYTHCRIGFNLAIVPTPTPKDADWRENHEWLPLIGLLVENERIGSVGIDGGLVEQARAGFHEARAGLLSGDAARFNGGSKKFAAALEAMGAKSAVYPSRAEIAREVGYNKAQPFYWTTILALAATVLLALSLGIAGRTPFVVGYALLLAALGMMVYGMYLRVMISGRAPVTNMYETILWSSFVASVLAVTLGIVYQTRIIPATAAIVIVLATLLANNMPINMGATIEPLQPVLRKNFWLIIHVLTIVASYGAFMLAWALGNVGLGYYLLGKDKPETIKPMAMFAYRAIQVGFLLLAAGTILGGWWAADSWGRFWGWDPKETWAFIALLGYAVVLHARFAGLLRLFGLLAGAVLGFSGIVMAWYGVNFVLGAGLHAYAFGDGGQPYVIAAALLNVAYVGSAYFAYRLRQPARAMNPAHTEPVDLSLGQEATVG